LMTASVAVQFLPGNSIELAALRLRELPYTALGLMLGAGLAIIEFLGPEGVAPFIYYQF